MIGWNPLSGMCNYFCENVLPLIFSTEADDKRKPPAFVIHNSRSLQNVSYFDNSKRIDKDSCALTMVRDWARSLDNIPGNTPHVKLFVEFFNGMNKTIAHAHLMSAQKDPSDITNVGIVEVRWYKENSRIVFKSKSETWIVSREKVDRMWATIEWEAKVTDKHQPLQYQRYQNHPEMVPHCTIPNPVPFCLFGQNSIAAREVVVFETRHPELLKVKEKEPEQFESLIVLNEQCKLIEKLPKKKWKRKSWTPLLSSVVFFKDYFISHDTLYMAALISGIFMINYWVTGTLYLHKESRFPAGLYICIIKLLYDSYVSKLFNSLKEAISTNEGQLALVEKEIEPIVLKSNNCFTWTRDKLAMVDITLEKKVWEYLFAVPMPHLEG